MGDIGLVIGEENTTLVGCYGDNVTTAVDTEAIKDTTPDTWDDDDEDTSDDSLELDDTECAICHQETATKFCKSCETPICDNEGCNETCPACSVSICPDCYDQSQDACGNYVTD